MSLFDIDIDRLKDIFLYNPQAPMIFSSGFFLWLFSWFIIIYMLLKKQDTPRILFVTLFSYYFYYKSSGTYFFLLGIVTVSDFFIARWMHRSHKVSIRKLLVVLSLCLNLGLLCYFKYTNFFGEIIASLTGGTFSALDIFLPVGISFFTFQSLSYTIDVYRKEITPLSSLLDYAFYVSFFPQLVAGPIVRARDFLPQIRKPLVVTQEMFGRGVYFIVCGLFKKAIISDYISVNFVERIFANPTLYSGVENLMGVYGYALQIYCDFSGYSDMAIGIALLLGFHFNINFDSPYKSASITEFWRRWHISLSSWLKDYLYISLGGNRKGKFRQYLNLIITMFLGGLWHGASWNFVVWGMFHGVALALHKGWMTITKQKKSTHGIRQPFLGKIWHWFGVAITFHFVCFCWIFFRNVSFENSVNMLGQIATNFHPELFGQLITGYWRVFALMLLGFLLHFAPVKWEQAFERNIIGLPFLGKVVLVVALIYLVIQIKSSEIQPFIYFQF
ncbi:MBOAT family protein [Bacteroides sp. 224]|uniref:MBOAT family O-acyltransferase n=1 Tax=Bacteroides sp. 224 TaxID=2302936 RepID=UPI0013D22648|nr:MBOAT family protein [Bacteroides sp. 224]NDV63882.1 MBOAT family protein [Bacteroides sp. 224]